TQSNIIIEGDGPSNTLIVNGTTASTAIQFTNGGTAEYRNGIRDIAFAQASGVTPTLGNAGLYVGNQVYFDMRNVQSYAYPAALYDAYIFDNMQNSTLYAITAGNSVHNGVIIKGGTGGLTATNINSFANGNNGFDISGGSNIWCFSCQAWGNTASGWIIYYTTAHNFQIYCYLCVGDTSGG